MSILYTISHTLAALCAEYTISLLIGSTVSLTLALWFLKEWRSKERVYRRKAAYIRKQQQQVEEWQNYFRQLHNRKQL